MNKIKSIGIVTIVDYNNYGNRLQNYATQEILKKKGYQVYTIKNIPPSRVHKGFVRNIKVFLDNVINNYIFRNKSRTNNFNSFTKNISETSYTVTNKRRHLDKLEKFNGIVIGSDQIWNPNFRREFFLDFTQDLEIPSISLAASFGVTNIPKTNFNFYRDNVKNIEKISVREYEGKEILKRLGNFDSQVVLDPTMMLGKDEWNKVTTVHRYKPQENYVLTYSLGGLSEPAEKIVDNIIKDYNYPIVRLGEKKYDKYYDVGPSEFLDYIKDSSLLITDSFHGVVFSLIYGIPFVIFEREDFKGKNSMNSRINTLSQHFNLHSRNIKNIKYENIFDIDKHSFEENLKIKQNEFNKFLDGGLKYFE